MISSGDWKKIQDLFHAVVELPEAEHIPYINGLKLSEELKDQLNKLLKADSKSSSQIKSLKQDISEIITDITFPEIENYDITEKIGSGGMGEVYKALDLKLSRDVAIKILNPHRSQDQKSQQRFLREARASAKIRHENICPVFDVSTTDAGMLYIVSAFCEGESLAQKISSNSLNYKMIFSVFEQLLNALSVAHAKGIIHRDLKPDNIIVDKHNRIQLVDFGIAKNFDDLQTQSGDVLGTPDYMSPEQFRGEAFDHRSDIWSCGILLFEMLKGKTPYQGKTAPEIMYTMLHESVAIPVDDTDPVFLFYQLGQKCLQVDKALRPANIDNILQMLSEIKNTLQEQNLLFEYPDYKIDKKDLSVNTTSYVVTNTNRNAVILTLHVLDEVISESLFIELSSIASKYKGILQKRNNATPVAKQNSLFVLFGYPLADELKIENAVHCGQQFTDLLNNCSMDYKLLVDIDDVIEDEHKFTIEALNSDTVNRLHTLTAQLDEGGLWLTKKFNSRLRNKHTNTQSSRLIVDEKGDVISCYLYTFLQEAQTNNEYVENSRFIGRDTQLSFLLENWEQAKEGDQQRILISGEAGIGKSRLIFELVNNIKDFSNVNLIELDCSPYEKGSSYFPILDYFNKQIEGENSLDKNHLADHFLSYLGTKGNSPSKLEKLLFLKLMNIPLSPEDEAILPIGDLLNKQYQDLILRILTFKNEGQTSLIIIEDLHWADTATGIILEKLLQPSSSNQSLVVMSSRPEFKPHWLSNLVTSNLYLSKLRSSQSEHLLKSLIEDASEDVLQNSESNDLEQLMPQLIERTGGNPLFIEEMAKTFINFDSQNAKITQHIPETIQDSLISRLEKIGVSQTLAHYAAVIGRDFNLELLQLSYSIADAEFKQQLHTLIQADIVHCMDGKQQYRFKHALIRDAAYQMITVASLRSLHQNLAKTLETHYKEVSEKQPELLAQHWEAAGEIENAIEYWLLAAQRNQQLSATSECIDICDHIVDIANENLDLQLARRFKLKAYTRKGPALMAKYGYADERINEVYSEALELCEEFQETESKIPILYGLWTYYCVKAEHKKAQKHAQNMVDFSEQRTSVEKCVSYSVLGITLFYLGQFEEAKPHFSHALNFYKEPDIQKHIVLYGHDFNVVTLSFQSWNECFLGNVEQAIHISKASVNYARKRNHQLSLTYAISFAAWLKLNLGQIDDAEILVKESIEICKEYDIAIFLGLSMSFHALILFSKGEVEKGHEIMAEAEKIFFGTGAKVFRASFFAAKAEVALLLQDIEAAESFLEQSLQIIETTTEEFGMVPALALKAAVYSEKQEVEQAAEYMNLTYQKIKLQKALGLQALLEQKGISFDGFE